MNSFDRHLSCLCDFFQREYVRRTETLAVKEVKGINETSWIESREERKKIIFKYNDTHMHTQ